MISISILQAYLRHSAEQQYESVPVPHFTLFFHPIDNLTYFNYAIPLAPDIRDAEGSLALLRTEFTKRNRMPRFEFIEEFAPLLPEVLRKAGFIEAARQQLMVCQAETYQPAPETTELQITELTNESEVSALQDFMSIQKNGFNPQDQGVVTPTEADHFRRMLGAGRAFLARREGQTIGVGMFTAPFDAISEVVGLATLEPFRRRGIATALTDRAVKRAMEQGARVVCLTAADVQAGRVYEKIGFRKYATMLAYIEKSIFRQD
jgi:ribosomal protein S18 acetylase RimI-like enzyme